MDKRAITLFAILAAVGLGAASAAGQVAADSFSNGPLANLAGSTGGFGWTSAWTRVGDESTNVSGPGLTWPFLDVTPGAAVTPAAAGETTGTAYQRTVAISSSVKTLYVSFLLREDVALNTWGGLRFGTGGDSVLAGLPDGAGYFGLATPDGTTDFTHYPRAPGDLRLIVVRLTKSTPPVTGVTVSLWIFGYYADYSSQPGYSYAELVLGDLPDVPTTLAIDNGTGFTTDEIRVGLSWSSVVPKDATWTNLGHGKLGSNGTPVLVGTGEISPHSTNQLALTRDAPLATAYIVLGLSEVDLPFKGGTLVPSMDLLFPVPTDAEGAATLPFVWPNGAPAGTTFYLQVWTHDEHAVLGLSASNGLRGLSSS